MYLSLSLKQFSTFVLINLLGRGEEKEKERERNINMRQNHQWDASHMHPDWGLISQPRRVPCSGGNQTDGPFALHDDTQPTEPHCSGLYFCFIQLLSTFFSGQLKARFEYRTVSFRNTSMYTTNR